MWITPSFQVLSPYMRMEHPLQVLLFLSTAIKANQSNNNQNYHSNRYDKFHVPNPPFGKFFYTQHHSLLNKFKKERTPLGISHVIIILKLNMHSQGYFDCFFILFIIPLFIRFYVYNKIHTYVLDNYKSLCMYLFLFIIMYVD